MAELRLHQRAVSAPLLLVACCCLLPSCSAVFDLFVPRLAMQEVIKTFTDSKVYYVYNGTVNKYALKFKIPIPMEVNKLHFCWINKAQREMPYSIGFTVSNKLAMRTPQLNISSRGLVPQTVSGFEVSLPCTGAARTEVSFDIQINVTMQPNNVTTLSIYRKKLCNRGSGDGDLADSRSKNVPASNSKNSAARLPETSGRSPPPPAPPGPPPSPTSAGFSGRDLAIFLGATSASILLIAGIVLVYFWRTKAAYSAAAINKQRSGGRQHQPQQPAGHQHRLVPPHHQPQAQHQRHQRGLGKGPSGYFAVAADAPAAAAAAAAVAAAANSIGLVETVSLGSGYTSCSLPSHQRNATSSPVTERRSAGDPREVAQEVQIPWERITLKCILMEGTYGRLYRGSMHIPADGAEPAAAQEVLIKTVTEAARQDQVTAFLQSGVLLAGLQHQNLNPLLAATQIPGDPRPHLVFPYPAEGNLKMYLIRCRNAQSMSAYCVLSTQQLIHMAVQIAQGLAHLHRRRIVHRDLACRNCVLTSDYTVKIGDSALAKEFFPEDYQSIGGDAEPRPVRWLSVEALTEGRFSTASDVWAFGVTLWELITRCLQPFQLTETAEMPRLLLGGYRLTKPTNCPDQLFSIMASCWHCSPDSRPKLTGLQTALAQFHDTLSAYV